MISLKNRIRDAFGHIQAEEELKEKTLAYLAAQRNNSPQKKNSGNSHSLNYRRLAAAAASLLILLAAGGGFSYQFLLTASAYIDLDVNPSVAIAVNSLGRVVSVSAYNQEGDDILSETDLRHRPYQEAVTTLLDSIASQGYLTESPLVSATVQSADSGLESRLLASLPDIIETSLVDHQAVSDTDTEVYAVSGQFRLEAQDHHLSPAKYQAIQELQELDPAVTFEECANHSISAIRQQTHEHRQRGQDESHGQGSGQGDGQGNGNQNGNGNGNGHHQNGH